VTKVRWDESQSNHDACVVTLLSRKSWALTIVYSFCPNSKCSIQ